MKVSTFIERPVLSAVISITIMVAGIIGLFTLPVEQYPDIAPPTVMVSTTYFGANAETMQKSVVAPLEEAINGVEDMTYLGNLGRQLPGRFRYTVLYVYGGHVRIGSLLEIDRDRGGTGVGSRGGHVGHIFHAVDRSRRRRLIA